jgi:hypothetical protein
MHPSAVLRGAELRSVTRQLTDATSGARALQIKEIPAIVIDGELFAGERAVEQAAEHLGRAAAAERGVRR